MHKFHWMIVSRKLTIQPLYISINFSRINQLKILLVAFIANYSLTGAKKLKV